MTVTDDAIEAIRVASFEAPRAGSHSEWKRRVEVILDEHARRVAAALNGTADVDGHWTVDWVSAPQSMRRGLFRNGEHVPLGEVARILNGTADLTALADAVRKHEAEPGLMVWKDRIVAAARTLVASTGTETDDAQ